MVQMVLQELQAQTVTNGTWYMVLQAHPVLPVQLVQMVVQEQVVLQVHQEQDGTSGTSGVTIADDGSNRLLVATGIGPEFSASIDLTYNPISQKLTLNGNFEQTGSLNISGSISGSSYTGSFTGSYLGDLIGTSSFADASTSASNALYASSASVAEQATSLSNLATSSFADRATSASIADDIKTGLTISASGIDVTGNLTATTITGSLSGSLIQGTTGSFTQITGSLSGSLIQGTSASFSDLIVTTLTETSAERFKTNIHPLDSQIDKITLLNPVTFDWKDNGNEDIGLIAEQVNEVYPTLISRNPDGEIQGIKYTKLITVLIEGIKELKSEIDDLKSQINK
jgi:hypothetical protein